MGGNNIKCFVFIVDIVFFNCLLYRDSALRKACINALVSFNLPIFLPFVIIVGTTFLTFPPICPD